MPRLFSLCLVSLAFASSAFGGSFELPLNRIPKRDSACPEMVKEISSRLKYQGVKVTGGRCARDEEASVDIVLQYEATKSLELESTLRRDTFSLGGWYRSESECESELNWAILDFENATGLEPFLAYCGKKGWSSDGRYYFPVVTAIGVGQYQFWTGEYAFSSKDFVGKVDVGTEIEKALIDRGILVTHVGKLDSQSSSIPIGYYSSKELRIQKGELVYGDSESHCLDLQKELKAGFAKLRQPPLTSVCVRNTGSAVPLVVAIASTSEEYLMAEVISNAYDSLSECRENLEQHQSMASYYVGKEELVAVTCGFFADQYYATAIIGYHP